MLLGVLKEIYKGSRRVQGEVEMPDEEARLPVRAFI